MHAVYNYSGFVDLIADTTALRPAADTGTPPAPVGPGENSANGPPTAETPLRDESQE